MSDAELTFHIGSMFCRHNGIGRPDITYTLVDIKFVKGDPVLILRNHDNGALETWEYGEFVREDFRKFWTD